MSEVERLDGIVGDSVSSFRSTTWLFLAFACVALVLATVGIYGLVSYSVNQRTYEIALRMAIGATAGSILRMMLVRSLRVSVAGLAVGIIGAILITRGLSAFLFEVTANRPGDLCAGGGVSVGGGADCESGAGIAGGAD